MLCALYHDIKRATSMFLYVIIVFTLAEISGVARDSRKSERIRVICLSPGCEYSLHQVWFESVKGLKS
jgi:hypothetical protein